MTNPTGGFTTTDLMAAAAKTLTDGGYRQVELRMPGWDTPTSRIFEDEYNVVGVTIWETCAELLESWPDAQGDLVSVISKYVGREDSKSWDGYLVLLSPGLASSEGTQLDTIRYNTTRLRKLVAVGDDLQEPSDVGRVLRALLPLAEAHDELKTQSALDLLPRLLKERDIEEETTNLLIETFREQGPLLERLHQRGGRR